jgi:hypothetical protein
LSDSVFEIFSSRANKFESDLLVSYASAKQLLTTKFDYSYQIRGFSLNYDLLLTSFLIFLKTSKTNATFKLSTTFYSTGFSKLNELVLFDNKLLYDYKKNCIFILLYPFIFQTTKPSALFPKSFSSPISYNVISTYTKSLKLLTA